MPYALKAALGLGNRPVEIRHLLSVAAVSEGSEESRLLPSIARKSEVKLFRSPSTRVFGSHSSATSADRRLKLLSRQMLNRPSTTTSKKKTRNTAVR